MTKVYGFILLIFLSGNAFGTAAGSSQPALTIPLLSWNDGQEKCEPSEEHYVEIQNARVRYVEAGSGPAVVMIHGNAGSVDDFDFKSLGLLCRDHRVIAVDRPGHGKSDRPDGLDATLPYQTRLLHETLLRLGVTRPVLVGHSWGGSEVLAYAVSYPQDLSAIVLLAPAAYPDGGPDQFMRAILKTPVVGDVSLTLG